MSEGTARPAISAAGVGARASCLGRVCHPARPTSVLRTGRPGARCTSQPRAPTTGRSTPDGRSSGGDHGPAATTTAPASTTPWSVTTPRTASPFCTRPRTVTCVLTSAPRSRASRARPTVSAAGSTRRPSSSSHPSARSADRAGSALRSPAGSSRSIRTPASRAACASAAAAARSSWSSSATIRNPTGLSSRWMGRARPSATSRYSAEDASAIGTSSGSRGTRSNPWFRPEAPAASSDRSNSATRAPRPASSRAVAQPMMPPPTTITSAPRPVIALTGWPALGRVSRRPRPARLPR